MSYVHQYIERCSGRCRVEPLFGDRVVRWLYDPLRENAPALFRLFTGASSSRALAFFNYDLVLGARLLGAERFLAACGIDRTECLDAPETLDTPRKVFERKIRYWQCRPMPSDPRAVVSPADARVLVGSLAEQSAFFLKDKFFTVEELLGAGRYRWLREFAGGDFAVFRLTPDKYHYNHVPVAGRVLDVYEVEGDYHSCNPQAVVSVITPYSKNKRVVTVIDTDVPGGTEVGLVAMVEVVALMIGEIVQCYSEREYCEPCLPAPGMFLHKGQPKSLYRPGSSTDVLLFQAGRVRFAQDLLTNQQRRDVSSRFTRGFQQPLVETDLQVRSVVGWAAKSTSAPFG
ncbi:phosphatidylserine decarboxylase [Geoalkalibacter halelectricus]|uniref:Phosphatidylserine decarboxylase n=1 Tax=Geoalkalibacter halelectricus TaxID=2847045 RepID=A0ABY5ZIK4_9BACT|nr:phosphatidylserine decarboxylase [Geoalkalibacter halelectricus]MDO3376629.1 phosphatidylserine decarboxylase [Geoalkalibacter halelectricus]UWZ78413.1 phosphatidylserine decarboxylase [Geoalkalibacter halelectricus]